MGKFCHPIERRAFSDGKASVPFRKRVSTAKYSKDDSLGAMSTACVNRRGFGSIALLGTFLSTGSSSLAANSTDVGSYLPPSDAGEDFVLFKPDKAKTPAIRAGTVDKDHPYSFSLPTNWQERKVANIQSGNYCQPRCAEPWTEVIFANEREGKVQVVVSPLVRLTNKKGATIEDVGSPDSFLAAVGPFITGTFLDPEDVLSMETCRGPDGLMYYYYTVYSTSGLNGPNLLTAATVKGDLALLFIIAADDKQYAKSKKKLQTMLKTFQA